MLAAFTDRSIPAKELLDLPVTVGSEGVGLVIRPSSADLRGLSGKPSSQPHLNSLWILYSSPGKCSRALRQPTRCDSEHCMTVVMLALGFTQKMFNATTSFERPLLGTMENRISVDVLGHTETSLPARSARTVCGPAFLRRHGRLLKYLGLVNLGVRQHGSTALLSKGSSIEQGGTQMTDHKLPSNRRLANDDCDGGIVGEGFGLSFRGWRHSLRPAAP